MPRERELHDKFFKLAKKEGFAARSAYKLLEIQERRFPIRRGDWLIDLGCAPGSWLQVSSKSVGSKGRVVGIDLSPTEIQHPENVRTFVADAFKADPLMLLACLNGVDYPFPPDAPPPLLRKADVVLSDMAPSTTGTPMADHFRSVELCRRVLELCNDLLDPGGNLVMKVFEGESYPELLKDCQSIFREAKGLRPEAVRDLSREIYIMGFGFKTLR